MKSWELEDSLVPRLVIDTFHNQCHLRRIKRTSNRSHDRLNHNLTSQQDKLSNFKVTWILNELIAPTKPALKFTSLSTGIFYHKVFQYDSTSMRLYENDREATERLYITTLTADLTDTLCLSADLKYLLQYLFHLCNVLATSIRSFGLTALVLIQSVNPDCLS